MLTLIVRSDKYDLNHAIVFSEKLIEKFHDFLYGTPSEDQLVSFPRNVLSQNFLLFCH